MKTWDNLTVAGDGTHHERAGQPAYAARFHAVLSFHEPGLAAVVDDSGAYHIDPLGQPAYGTRFRRTFGFYEGLAAVETATGWLHIRPHGCPAYDQFFGWCGNFQGARCAVRTRDGTYLHLRPDGSRAYDQHWRYAGDYREGAAVVQTASGLHSHVDLDGRLVHGRWFVDLSVFHKGLAAARDEDGWMHIDRRGASVYGRRFAAVEPFYNGQARVERLDGGLEVIASDGHSLLELRPARRSDFAALSGDMVGFWRTQTIRTAVEAGVFEALPGDPTRVATVCGLDLSRCARLLRALGDLRLVDRSGDTWDVSPRGAYLLRNHPLTLAHAALEYGTHLQALWQPLPEALRAGSSWAPPDVFGQVAASPGRTKPHHQMLRSYGRHDYAAVPEALQLGGDETVIDAGGGLGHLGEALLRLHPELKVTVLERREVVDLMELPPDLDGRLVGQVGDLLQPWPLDADAVVMARVLHDWDDQHAAVILSRARAALSGGGRLFVVEMVLPETGFAGGLCDLHLLMVTGGQERTVADYHRLLAGAGFELTEVRRLPSLVSVIVGVAR